MFYRQSIIAFGFVVPAVICAAVAGGGIFLRSKATASFQQKQSLHKASEASNRNSQSIEAQIRRKREHVDRWKSQMEKEMKNTLTSHLRDISDKLPQKEFTQTAVEWPNGSGGIAAGSAQNSSQVRLAFRATFRSMQKALIELETVMPQLQLQEMKIDPSPSSASSLNFHVTYTAWEK